MPGGKSLNEKSPVLPVAVDAVVAPEMDTTTAASAVPELSLTVPATTPTLGEAGAGAVAASAAAGANETRSAHHTARVAHMSCRNVILLGKRQGGTCGSTLRGAGYRAVNAALSKCKVRYRGVKLAT